MKLVVLAIGLAAVACSRAPRDRMAPPGDGARAVAADDGADSGVAPAPGSVPAPAFAAAVAGRYTLAPAARTVPLAAVRVFVTLDAAGAARVGTVGTDALDGGVLVGMPRQSDHGDDDTPPGTPRLRDTVRARLGRGAPPPVLDQASRDELRTSGCTHWTGPRAVSWGYSKALRFEVLAFARAGDSAGAETVLLADGAAPALRLIQAADDSPVARIAVAGDRGAAALPVHVGGAVALGDPICIAANRSVSIERGSVDIRGDGLKHDSFGAIAFGAAGPDRAALVDIYRTALAADQLAPGRQPVVHVDHDVTVATLVVVLDAMLEAGETGFVLHARPDLRQQPRPRTRP